MKKAYKKTELGEIPEAWDVIFVNELFNKDKNKRFIGVKSIDYKNSGKFPIIDQGEKYISGYTDDKNKTYTDELPVIIFGDHTRNFKYVDFVFALGADGTKVLNLKKNNDLKYLYFLLKNITFENEGYRRYMQVLKSKKISVSNCVKEQKKIAEVLSTVDEAIENVDRKIRAVEKLKKGMMQKLLTRGIGHKKFKKTELGEIPEEWEIIKLGNKKYFDLLVGGTPSKKINEYWKNGTINWVRSSDLEKKYLYDIEKKITKLGLDNSAAKLIPNGSVVISTRVSLGNCSIAKQNLATSQDCTGIIIKDKSINEEYLYYVLKTMSSKIKKLGEGSTIKGITQETLKNISVTIPTKTEQLQISNILKQLDNKFEIGERLLSHYKMVKKSLMADLLSGKKRVVLGR